MSNATRTTVSSGAVENTIVSISATCSNGVQLGPVTVGNGQGSSAYTTSDNVFSFSAYSAGVIITPNVVGGVNYFNKFLTQ